MKHPALASPCAAEIQFRKDGISRCRVCEQVIAELKAKDSLKSRVFVFWDPLACFELHHTLLEATTS